MIELIDTHAHLSFEQLADHVPQVLERSRQAGITQWITVGTDPDENRKALELATEHDSLYAALGIHPHEARLVTDDILAELKTLAAGDKVVALGETGLDFHYNFSPPDRQREVFIDQINLAVELALPLIIHCRDAFDDALLILEKHAAGIDHIVFHCFGGSADQARIILDHGWHISFTGVVTFKNAHQVRKAAEAVPLDRMMIETDCPYMSPEPMRKQRVNEPALLVHTARFLAELKATPLEAFAQQVTATSKRFFNLP